MSQRIHNNTFRISTCTGNSMVCRLREYHGSQVMQRDECVLEGWMAMVHHHATEPIGKVKRKNGTRKASHRGA